MACNEIFRNYYVTYLKSVENINENNLNPKKKPKKNEKRKIIYIQR